MREARGRGLGMCEWAGEGEGDVDVLSSFNRGSGVMFTYTFN